MTPSKKQLAEDWQGFLKSIREETSVDFDMDFAAREKRRKHLEAHPLEWIKEMFPNYATYDFADFQKNYVKRILANLQNWYEVISWARELAKSTITMFLVLYLSLTKRRRNIVLVSNSKDNAVDLLAHYRAQLEANQRISFYYGEQQGTKWTEEWFVAKCGASFRAIGAGQSPRGKKNEAIRPDTILVDDFDTDEECRNPDIITQKWNWFENALYFTRSFSESLLTIWCGNIIAKDCCIVRAGEKAKELSKREKPLGNWDIINIKMVDIRHPNPVEDFARGKSVWPQKNSEEIIEEVLAQVSASAAQKECFNNPLVEGEIFKELHWGEVPPLNKFRFLVAYGDPAPSENRSKNSSTKGVWLVGLLNGNYYIIKGFLDRSLNNEFIDWYFLLDQYVNDKTVVYNFVENNSLQDPFYQQVLIPHVREKRISWGKQLDIKADSLKKTDKAARIEGNLEPLNRTGRLIFNIAEKEDPHMIRLTQQFSLFSMRLKYPADGPDTIEGAKRILDMKHAATGVIATIPVRALRSKNKYRI
jgi:hypothetical protein